jgi:hypothetical protein
LLSFLSHTHTQVVKTQKSRAWGKERLNEQERDHIESQYLNLAAYSNKLIRAGAVPGQKRGEKGTSIYYSVDRVHHDAENPEEEEALESIAKRRAVIKDSWDFYRMICSLLRDRRKYDEVFRKLQHDPVYPYLNSMTGLNDPGDDGEDGTDKVVIQKDLAEYSDMTKTQVAGHLVKKAEEALPSLVEICKALAGSLGMEEVGVGPVKETQAAIRKADRKYGGDLLKVTDYCRALLVVKDFPSLLALLELARDSFGPLIRRVKLSTLKSESKSLPGGYRDCKINLELKGEYELVGIGGSRIETTNHKLTVLSFFFPDQVTFARSRSICGPCGPFAAWMDSATTVIASSTRRIRSTTPTRHSMDWTARPWPS